MQTTKLKRLSHCISVILLSASAVGIVGTAAAGEVVASKKVEINGDTYTFSKSIDSKGNLSDSVITKNGVATTESALPKQTLHIVSPQVQAAMVAAKRTGDQKIKVTIALDLATQLDSDRLESGDIILDHGQVTSIRSKGNTVSKTEFKIIEKDQLKQQREDGRKVVELRDSQLSDFLEHYGLESAKGADQSRKSTNSSTTLELTVKQLKQLIAADDKRVRGIELHQEGEDDIAQAMMDTNITNYALPYSSRRGGGIGVYMTESGCANESRISNYDRLSGSETNHSRNVGAIIRAVAPNARLYCRGSAVLPTVFDMIGIFSSVTTPIRIVTRSNSSNDTTSYNTLDRDWDNFAYSWNVATFNSGGNTGNGTGNVRSPGKGLNLITVGNYNDSGNSIVSSSPFRDPNTGNEKPEIVAPGASITAGGFTMTGTSQATPHAAAFAADMMSGASYLVQRPYLLKAKMLAGATDSISGGYDKVGLGGIDFLSTHYSGHASWWSGNNGSFNSFDSGDGSSDGYISKRVYISGGWGNVRAAISWMNRGTYTYDNRNAAHPIGMDLDLRVYDPNGNYVGGSFTWDDGFEDVNFDPAISGYYTFKISRYANRDTSSAFRLGLYVNYY